MFAAARDNLTSIVAKRGVARIVYFHTDHFEPWRTFDGRAVFGHENTRDLERFASTIAGIEYARRPSLFYKPHLNFALRQGDDMMRATPDDLIGFMRRSPDQERAARAALIPLLEQTGSQFQLHVHHENYTANATVTAAGHDIGRYLATADGCGGDDARFAFAVRQNLDIIARETGRRLDRWFFVHGHWALNASDDADCRIIHEIEILHRLGCRGDFTCPAGRTHVDPRHDRPYLCRPVAVSKGYDTPEAEPEPAAGAGIEKGRDKFLIWASAIKHGATSIDHYSPFVRRRADDLPKAAARILEQSYLHDGTLYVKTHGHSMQPAYFDGSAPAYFPHAYPPTRDMFSLIFDAGSAAGAEIEFLTVSEVYDRLLQSPVRDETQMLEAFAVRHNEPVAAGSARNRLAARVSTRVSRWTARYFLSRKAS